MSELVFLKNEQALTTSLKIAEIFGKEHKHVIRDIENLIEQTASVRQRPNLGSAKMFVKTSYQAENGGRRYPMYLMNRDGFTLLAMGFTGKKALKFKLDYIQEFNRMEAALAERQSVRWLEAREASKTGYKELSTVIHELYVFAVENGCKVSEKVFYMNFAKLINKTLGINPKSRDAVSWWKLFEIDKLQFMAKTIIAGLLAKGADYHQPYKDCKETFDAYARLSFINQRLLEA